MDVPGVRTYTRPGPERSYQYLKRGIAPTGVIYIHTVGRGTPEPIRLGRLCKPCLQAVIYEPRIPLLLLWGVSSMHGKPFVQLKFPRMTVLGNLFSCTSFENMLLFNGKFHIGLTWSHFRLLSSQVSIQPFANVVGKHLHILIKIPACKFYLHKESPRSCDSGGFLLLLMREWSIHFVRSYYTTFNWKCKVQYHHTWLIKYDIAKALHARACAGECGGSPKGSMKLICK